PTLDVHSAGTKPASRVHPHAVTVMREAGIDLGGHIPKSVDLFLHQSFDYVVTVCDNARESCPVFAGSVKHRLHIGFDDPADATGTEEQILAKFRRVRDQIKERFGQFYASVLLPRRPTA
ncbi:MAG: arsenate reductase ArsC, partial [Bacteroidetes bacterium]|nr:arsenate reductase ArsC [Bacteroidota bacterium]